MTCPECCKYVLAIFIPPLGVYMHLKWNCKLPILWAFLLCFIILAGVIYALWFICTHDEEGNPKGESGGGGDAKASTKPTQSTKASTAPKKK